MVESNMEINGTSTGSLGLGSFSFASVIHNSQEDNWGDACDAKSLTG